MTSISSLRSLTLDLPPSCIAFCPTQPGYFVVGTYYLHTKENGPSDGRPHITENADTPSPEDSAPSERDGQNQQKRTGSLILFRLNGDTITHVSTTETDFAILDVQWTWHPGRLGDLLAVATSVGLVTFYKLERKDGAGQQRDLILSSWKYVSDPSVLILSVAWHPYRDHVVGVTMSNGNVSLCETVEGDLWSQDAVVYSNDIHRHELEAWTLAFVGDGSTNVMSGGDDCVLQYSTVNPMCYRVVQWQDRKLHQAGVTAILPLTPDLVVTGSYDDHIRLVSFEAGARRQVRAELNLGGGVWRLKLLEPSSLPIAAGTSRRSDALLRAKSIVILASCMHAGSHIVRLCRGSDGGWQFDVMAKFEEHESMNYGGDVQPGNDPRKSIISTSFYDKRLCLWRFDTTTACEGMEGNRG